MCTTIIKNKNMGHIIEKREQLKSNFEYTLAKKTIKKHSLISLKQQTKVLVEMDEDFKPFLTKLTTQINGMKNGELNEERREKIKNLVSKHLNTTS